MTNRAFAWLVLAASSPVLIAGPLVLESAPNLTIPDNSCLDREFGRGEGGVSDTIFFPPVPFLDEIQIEVQIDHTWRSDLQIAVSSTASSTPRLVSLRGDASSTPRLANNHDTSNDNYYATFDDSAAVACSSAAACGGAGHCSSAVEGLHCQPDEPLLSLVTASATPQFVRLQLCDRGTGDIGILRRWRVLLFGTPIPVELQSFTIE